MKSWACWASLAIYLTLSASLAISQGVSNQVEHWERGFFTAPTDQPNMRIFIWFYEWHMFDAVLPGIHTHGPREWTGFNWETSSDPSRGSMEEAGIKLEVIGRAEGADLLLTIENRSDHEWPQIAAIIPCFNPGPNPEKYPDYSTPWNEAFVDKDKTNTWFISENGLELLQDRSIHFNYRLRKQVELVRVDRGPFVFDSKWPTSASNAKEGLIVRESLDGEWVAGIAWEHSLSSQGHNPWFCMHLSVLVGPLKPGETRQVRGKIYLFRGSKEDCYRRYLTDFKTATPR